MIGLFKISLISAHYLALTPINLEATKIRFHYAPSSSVLRIQPPDPEHLYHTGDDILIDSSKLVPFMFLYLEK